MPSTIRAMSATTELTADGRDEGVRVRIKGTNLLDAKFRFEQSANGITRMQREYTTGRTLSVGFSWEF